MFGVAVTAGSGRVDGKHSAVWCLRILHLHRDVGMADHTAIVHGLRFPRCSMTGTAGARNFRMRRDLAYGFSRNGMQRPRAEHLSAAGKGIAHDEQRRDQRGEDAGTCQAAQAVSLHSPVPC